MNTTSPMHLNDELLYEMNTIVDVSYNFLCEICYEFHDNTKKISCTNNKCNKHMCEICFKKWSVKNKKYDCVYCTIPLDVSYANIDIDIENNVMLSREEVVTRTDNFCLAMGKTFCVLMVSPSIIGLSYLIGLVYTSCFDKMCIFFNTVLGMMTLIFLLSLKLYCCKDNNRINL